ncbi:hypothetical protein GCM10010420_24890 [Streptomyces glaucosporus]|uniref:Uncharacterized protein n=1 Tax=Streptomyces glaucosporus TaxID=284044 RepID=A0ABN3IAM3_9ACTN
MELTWHKAAAGHYFATNGNGQRIATARKEGNAWHGTVVGLGFSFTGRRLADVKELAHRHVERIYGEGEWTLFPARDLKPGMIVATDAMREEREIVSVSVDTDAQTVSAELTSESSRELGFNLDAEYAVGEYVRVKVVPTESVRAESLAEGDVIHFHDGQATVTRVERVESSLAQLRVCYAFRAANGTTPQCAATVYPGSRFERTVKPAVAEMIEDAPAVEVGDVIRFYDCDATVTAVSESVVTFVRQDGTTGTKPVGAPLNVVGKVAEEPALTCTLDDPADAQALVEWQADERFAPEAHGMQTIDLHPFTAIVDVIAGTGVLVTPPATENVSLSDGGATLHDALLADALRGLLPYGIKAMEGEDGGLSLEGVTEDGRKIFSLYLSDCITAEPTFEEIAVSIEALRQAAGL